MHHQHLHEVIKFRSSHPTSNPLQDETLETSATTEAIEAKKPNSPPSGPAGRPFSPQRGSSHPPSLTPTHRPPPRDLNSSIASNLASARGIPSGQRRRGTPVSPSVSAEQAGGKISTSTEKKRQSEQTKSREQKSNIDRTGHQDSENTEKALKSRGDAVTSRKQDTAPAAEPAAVRDIDSQTGSGESFQRFFSTFEGFISKLSAPLAFAGLPLTGDSPPAIATEASSTRAVAVEPERAVSGPDLSKIFSKAALRAVKESHGPNFIGPGGESFYVVPTTGGTISYADILSRAEQARRASLDGPGGQAAGSRIEDDDEPEFVDAREMPQTPSPEKSRHGGGRTWRFTAPSPAPPSLASNKTPEELQLENQALKQLSDTLSRRLHMWEVNAQSSSMALQQSLRALHRSPVASEAGRSAGEDVGSSDKMRELEEQLRSTTRELERVGRENEKLRGVVGRYREKWEMLKEGARLRREGGKTTDDAGKE